MHNATILTTFPHVLILSENDKGLDKIIGDVHGCLEQLQQVVTDLKPDDRLFICGDLIDRGPASLAVLDYIREINQDKQQIFIVRGNHEEMFIDYINSFLKKDLSEHDKENFSSCQIQYRRNGGLWVSEILDSGDEQKLALLIRHKKWLEALPYIISVDGEHPFQVVHSQKPNVILDKLTKLSLDEIHTSLEVRPHALDKTLINADIDTVVYCAHTIGGGMRYFSNHINLDFGTFKYRKIILANHTAKRLQIFSDTLEVSADHLDDDLALAYYSLIPYHAAREESAEEILYMISVISKKIIKKAKEDIMTAYSDQVNQIFDIQTAMISSLKGFVSEDLNAEVLRLFHHQYEAKSAMPKPTNLQQPE